jgi:transcription antitermination protein NusB
MAQKQQKSKTGGPRSASRLAAVQALYQLQLSEDPKSKLTIEEFKSFRLGAEIEGAQFVDADEAMFADIAEGGWERREEWDDMIRPCLSQGWALDRIEPIVHAIFRAGVYELVARPDVPTAVVINEYVDVAHAFLERTEVSFVNGVLDKMAKAARS